MRTILKVDFFSKYGLNVSKHVSGEKILRIAREVENAYIRSWAGSELFSWLLENSENEDYNHFYFELYEVIARLVYARLLLDNEKVTRLKAVEKDNRFSQNVKIESVQSEVSTQLSLARLVFKNLTFPIEAPEVCSDKQTIYFFNEFYL